MIQTGDVVTGSGKDQWLMQGMLGKGSCCTVYLAQHLKTKKKRALKLYKEGLNYAAAQEREALLLDLVCRANGPSPHLVETIDDFDHEDRPCLIQELLEGDLRQLIVKNSGCGLSLYLIQRLGRDLLRGLAHLHKSGFVHGDLKASNLMWSPQHGCLKIIDFGLSFHVQDVAVGQLQSSGFRAPEVELWNSQCRLVPDQYPWEDTSRDPGSKSPPPGGPQDKSCNDSPRAGDGRERGAVNATEYHTGHPAGGSGSGCCVGGVASADGGVARAPEGGGVVAECGRPGRECDVWSVGCILMELVTGSWRRTTRRLIGREASIHSDYHRHIADIFKDLQDSCEEEEMRPHLTDLQHLIARMLLECQGERPKADECLAEAFFTRRILRGSFVDLLILPTRVLRLLNVLEESDLEDAASFEELKEDLLAECSTHGQVSNFVLPLEEPARGKVFVEFLSSDGATAAFQGLSHRTYNGHTVIITYFPVDDFRDGDLY